MQHTPFSVAVIGEALVDIFPDRVVPGGAPFNVARHLAALGERPLAIARIGRDAHGELIAAEFARFGMARDALQRDASHPTGHVTVRLAEGQPSFDIAGNQAWDHLDAHEAVRAVQAAAPSTVCFGTLAQRGATSRAAVRQVLEATPALRVLDLNLRAPHIDRTLVGESLMLADVVKVNDDEANQVLRWFAPHGEAADLLDRFGLKRIVITRGADGWSCVDADEGELHGASPPVDVVDTVGAGDGFTAVMLVGECRGWPLATVLDRAARFAAGVCTFVGGALPGHPLYPQTRQAWRASPPAAGMA